LLHAPGRGRGGDSAPRRSGIARSRRVVRGAAARSVCSDRSGRVLRGGGRDVLHGPAQAAARIPGAVRTVSRFLPAGPADGCNSGTGGLTGGKVALVRRIPAMRAGRSSPILPPSRRARSAVTTRGALRAEVHGSFPGLTPILTIGATTGPALEQYMIRIFNHYLSLRVLML